MESITTIQSKGRITRAGLQELFNSVAEFRRYLLANPELLPTAADIQLMPSNGSMSGASAGGGLPMKSDDRMAALEVQFGLSDAEHLTWPVARSVLDCVGLVIWIAEEFRSEDLDVVRHLNEYGSRPVFAIQAGLVRIGPSPWALELTVVAAGFDDADGSGASEDRRDRYRSYWAAFAAAAASTTLRRSLRDQVHDCRQELAWRSADEVEFRVAVTPCTARIALDVGRPGQVPEAYRRAVYAALRHRRASLEVAFGGELIWCDDSCSISMVVVQGGYEADIEAGAALAVATLIRFHDALIPALRKLPWRRLKRRLM